MILDRNNIVHKGYPWCQQTSISAKSLKTDQENARYLKCSILMVLPGAILIAVL